VLSVLGFRGRAVILGFPWGERFLESGGYSIAEGLSVDSEVGIEDESWAGPN